MHIPARRRSDFDEARIYAYPEYLRARSPSHLRNPDEARLLRQTRLITHRRTAGGVGALLLEASLIKQQQPLYNQKSRRSRQPCALRLDAAGRSEVVDAPTHNFATTPDLFGLYGSRHAERDSLRDLADLHKLCYGAPRLERLAPERACFRASPHQCADETPAAHQARLREALETLRVACWSHAGAIGLRERDEEDLEQIHVIRNWCCLGSADSLAVARTLDRAPPVSMSTATRSSAACCSRARSISSRCEGSPCPPRSAVC